MSQFKTHATEVQKKTEPARQLEQEVTRQPEEGAVQPVTPQAAYRRAQVNRNGLRAADLLALQRAVGNRRVQQVMRRRIVKIDGHQQNTFVEAKCRHRLQTQLIVGAPSDATAKSSTYREELWERPPIALASGITEELSTLIKDKKRRQDAIDKIIRESKMQFPEGFPVRYNPALDDANCAGTTSSMEVEIGPKCFDSVSLLYSTIYHEYVHVKQRSAQKATKTTEFESIEKAKREVEAVFFGLQGARVTGIAKNFCEVAAHFEYLQSNYDTAIDGCVRLWRKRESPQTKLNKLYQETTEDYREAMKIISYLWDQRFLSDETTAAEFRCLYLWGERWRLFGPSEEEGPSEKEVIQAGQKAGLLPMENVK